jgi:hypothetical protein
MSDAIEGIGKIGRRKTEEASAASNFTPAQMGQNLNQPKIEDNKEQISKIDQTDKVTFSDEVKKGEV